MICSALVQYMYQIQINGANVLSVENKQPATYKYVKMFAASPWYEPVEGKIRNILVTDGAKDDEEIDPENENVDKIEQEEAKQYFDGYSEAAAGFVGINLQIGL
jgi:hypothetical protein